MSISLVQYGQYLQYMFSSILMLLIFGTVYLKITPVRELKLIKNGNLACALSFGGALVGFCLRWHPASPTASACPTSFCGARPPPCCRFWCTSPPPA